jgi:hypothetical protein
MLLLPLASNWDSPGFFHYSSHATEAGRNQNKNWPTSTCSILLAPADQIKGSPIYPLVGSWLGYCVIPYFCQLDRYSWCYVDPAFQNAAFLLAQTVHCSTVMLIRPPCEFWPAPLAQHGGGWHTVVFTVFSNSHFPTMNAVSCLPLMLRIHPPVVCCPLMTMAARILTN